MNGPDSETPTREDYLRGVESIIAMLRENPDVPLPNGWDGYSRITVHTNEKGTLANVVRAMGGGEKEYGGSYFAVVKAFGPVIFQVMSSRETVCRRVVKGFRTVPAREAYTVADVEWICDDSIFAEKGAQ